LPLVIAATARRRPSLVPLLAIGCMIGCTAWRIADRVFGWNEALYFRTQFRLDGLFCGVLLAWTARHRPRVMAWAARRRRLLIAVGVVLVSPMLVLDKDVHPGFVLSVGLTLLYLGYGCMVLAAATMDTPWTHRFPRVIGFVGLYSYSIYLWFEDLARTPVGALVRRGALSSLPPSLRWATAQLAYVLLAVAMGALASLAIERPMLKVRDRLFPSRVRTTAARS
jgi:peptidoglycan/LPS O-acetylase OafA/YrhL